jgi:hypothetical protein
VKNACVDDDFDHIYENKIKSGDTNLTANETGDYDIKIENFHENEFVTENRGRNIYDDKMNKKYSKKKEGNYYRERWVLY